MGLVVGMEEVEALKGDQRFAAYACLDATGTREVYDVLRPRLTESQEKIYRWTMAQMGPAITMGRRGILVDTAARDEAVKALEATLKKAEEAVREHPLVEEVWDGETIETGLCEKATRKDGHHKWPQRWDGERRCVDCGAPRVKGAPFEPGSNDQTAKLLYKLLKVPAPGGKSGEFAVDEDSLDSIRRAGRTLQETKSGAVQKRKEEGLPELIGLILEVRDCVKQLGFLRTPLSKTARMHATFRPMGTWTGRWSAKKDPFDLGRNAQNVSEQHRHVFTADPDCRLGYSDLKTAESLVAGYLAGDEAYIEAHKGDVHTRMTRLLWPEELNWTGDDKKDKELAQTHYPEWDDVAGHDYRFQAKRIVHGSTYGQSPYGIARLMHIPQIVAKKAQAAFFGAFPRIREWQRFIYAAVVEGLPLVTPFGRSVQLLGRPWDDHTYRQGLAFVPQSTVGDILNTALFRLWSKHDPDLIWLLAQVHDAVLMEWAKKDEDKAVSAIRECMKVDLPVTDIYGKKRVCTIGCELAIGENWGKYNDKAEKGRINLKGIREVKL